MAVSLWQLVFSQVRQTTPPLFGDGEEYDDYYDAGDDAGVAGGAGPAQKVAPFLRETPPGSICLSLSTLIGQIKTHLSLSTTPT